ncbi:MAG: oligosaccharide flippase family protein [Burkholderiaceae bacterium]
MSGNDFRELGRFKLATWAALTLGYFDRQLPRIVLARTMGPAAVGLYSLAMRLQEFVVGILVVPAYQVVHAGVSRDQAHRDRVARVALGAMQLAAALTAPVFLGLAALAPVLVPALFGPEWVEAVASVQVLMVLATRSPVTIVQTAVIRGLGKAHWHLGLAGLGAMSMFALILLAVPYGVTAVAAAAGLRAMILFPISAWLVRRLTGLGVGAQAAAGAGALMAAATMALSVWALLAWLAGVASDGMAIAGAIGAGIILYPILLRMTSPSSRPLLDRVLGAIGRRDLPALRRALGDVGTASN